MAVAPCGTGCPAGDVLDGRRARGRQRVEVVDRDRAVVLAGEPPVGGGDRALAVPVHGLSIPLASTAPMSRPGALDGTWTPGPTSVGRCAPRMATVGACRPPSTSTGCHTASISIVQRVSISARRGRCGPGLQLQVRRDQRLEHPPRMGSRLELELGRGVDDEPGLRRGVRPALQLQVRGRMPRREASRCVPGLERDRRRAWVTFLPLRADVHSAGQREVRGGVAAARGAGTVPAAKARFGAVCLTISPVSAAWFPAAKARLGATWIGRRLSVRPCVRRRAPGWARPGPPCGRGSRCAFLRPGRGSGRPGWRCS